MRGLTSESVNPINITLESFIGLSPGNVPRTTGLFGLPSYTRGFIKAFIRVFTIAVIVILAILVPSFDTVMALMGSAMAFSICIVLPLAFHLKIFGKEIPKKERALNWFLIVTCSVMAVIGTAWVFIPKDMRERMDP